MTSFFEKLSAYLYHTHGHTVDPSASPAPFVLLKRPGRDIEITAWTLPYPQPDVATVEAVTDEQVSASRIDPAKASFASTLAGLPRSPDYKFALVYDMIQWICINRLGMTPEEYVAASQSMYEAWCDKVYRV